MTEEYKKGIKDTVDLLADMFECDSCPMLFECKNDGKCKQRVAEWVEKELEE